MKRALPMRLLPIRLLFTCVAAAAIGSMPDATLAQESWARCGQLPEPVAEMKAGIEAALAAGTLDELAALADEGEFIASYGESATLEVWQQLAADSVDIREVARTLLGLGCTVAAVDDTAYYTWPAAIDVAYGDLTEDERASLAELHGMALEALYVDGPETGYYVGWSLTITGDGDWFSLVAGD